MELEQIRGVHLPCVCRFLSQGCEFGENLDIIIVFYFYVGAGVPTIHYIDLPLERTRIPSAYVFL